MICGASWSNGKSKVHLKVPRVEGSNPRADFFENRAYHEARNEERREARNKEQTNNNNNNNNNNRFISLKLGKTFVNEKVDEVNVPRMHNEIWNFDDEG